MSTLSLASTLVLAQEEPQVLPDHSDTGSDTDLAPLSPISQEQNLTTENTPYITPDPVMETSYDLRLTKGNILSALTPDQSSEEESTTLFRASEEEARDIPGFQHLVATLPLRKEIPQKVMFVRSKELGTFDTLIVDRNLDGSFVGEAPIIIDKEALADDSTQTESRDGMYMVEFQTALMTEHVHPEYLPDFGDFPAILRLKWTDLNTKPKELIWFGYYFYQTEIHVADTAYQILLHDINNDGKITAQDRWILKDKNKDLPDDSSRSITDFNWINGIAWKIDIQSARGNKAYIYRFDPKVTYEQDMNSRDPWSDDKNSERSEWEDRLSILTDHDSLLKQAADKNKLSILKFESTWCESCSAINIFVLPQQRVVNASTEYIWARFNDEDHADLATQYNVTEYPTFIILNPEGKELTRFHEVNGDTLVKNLRIGLDIHRSQEEQKAQETHIETFVSDDSPGLTEEAPNNPTLSPSTSSSENP